MKIRYSILAVALLVSAANYAQKSEIKALTKLTDKQSISEKDLASFIKNSDALSAMSGLSAEDQAAAEYFKTMQPVLKAFADYQKNPTSVAGIKQNLPIAKISEIVKKLADIKKNDPTAKKEYSAKVNQTFAQFESIVHQITMDSYKNSKLDEASVGFETLFDINNTKSEYLYNAAVLAHQNNKLDRAVTLYKNLLDSGYTGEAVYYKAVNKASGQEETFETKAARDKAIGTKVFEKPSEEKVASKRGEIYKNVVNILLFQNKTEDAKGLMTEARKLNPKDTDLILAEANLYYQAGDKAKYSQLVQEAISLKPNDAVLYYNLGVVAADAKDTENAAKYYKKAIELNPQDFNSYNNLGVLYIADDVNLVNKMNALGMSKKEQVQYDALAKKRKENFTLALPYFEKAYQIKPSEDLKALLLNTYRNLDMDAKHKALKNK
nr:tetratricopeptide repeat protein [uncultured Flavobacterium sp.]